MSKGRNVPTVYLNDLLYRAEAAACWAVDPWLRRWWEVRIIFLRGALGKLRKVP